ncbi:hypothetical protein ACXKGW_29910, partial [Klebsiella pneumoniae subsp. pneumoniae]
FPLDGYLRAINFSKSSLDVEENEEKERALKLDLLSDGIVKPLHVTYLKFDISMKAVNHK